VHSSELHATRRAYVTVDVDDGCYKDSKKKL